MSILRDSLILIDVGGESVVVSASFGGVSDCGGESSGCGCEESGFDAEGSGFGDKRLGFGGEGSGYLLDLDCEEEVVIVTVFSPVKPSCIRSCLEREFLAIAQIDFLSLDPVHFVCHRCTPIASYFFLRMRSKVRRRTFDFSPLPSTSILLFTTIVAHCDPELLRNILPAKLTSICVSFLFLGLRIFSRISAS